MWEGSRKLHCPRNHNFVLSPKFFLLTADIIEAIPVPGLFQMQVEIVKGAITSVRMVPSISPFPVSSPNGSPC